ncbi:HD domain-containing phosphohydrolase [Fundidesulfovibrio magnetotacticus]|uniref:HD domain-containing phosphohydrolase n=1 Tax=Fundidesulfovibrio magnetotacticus TaxID=2730080 RepID=UPI0015655462|nr:HD domain-containing phosphohydrolase [Fundidesulfovibrio magnetotacticus]
MVDDSPSLVHYLKTALSAARYHVHTAYNGREAVEVIKSRPVDVILCDLQMPEMDGKKLRRKLMAHGRYSRIPFVAMSAHDTAENFNAMRELQAAAFLTKPFKPEQLFIVLSRLQEEARLQELSERRLVRLEKNLLVRSIVSLAQALDARDNCTRTHSVAAARVAVKIAARMGIPRADIRQLFIAGKLHDIGKIGIPDAILQKPARLTEEEFAVIKTHPQAGARILAPIPSLREAAEIIHCHHERPDGKGYPRGLSGGEIHFLAHILSIADVFEALMSDRPYRRGLPLEETLTIMSGGRGTQFHAECFDSFLILVREGCFAGVGKGREGAAGATCPDPA